TVLHAKQFFGKLGIMLAILGNLLKPRIAQVLTPLANPLPEVIVDAIRNVKVLVVGPVVVAFCKTNLVLSKRFAVRAAGILLVRRTVADVTVDDDQSGPVNGVLKGSKGAREHFQVIGVADSSYVPPVADEAGRHIFREGQSSISFDGDVIVVIDPAE